MSRNLDSGTIATISGQSVQLAIFFYGSFTDGDVYVWSGIGPISWNGRTWLGLGTGGGECLGSISSISEDSAMNAQSVTVSLSGIDPTMVQHALLNVQQGKPASIWLNFFSSAGAVIGSALCYSGLIDQPTFEEGSTDCKLSLALESRLSDLQRAQQRRWTPQEQRSRFPTDDGFNFVNEMLNYYATWGGN